MPDKTIRKYYHTSSGSMQESHYKATDVFSDVDGMSLFYILKESDRAPNMIEVRGEVIESAVYQDRRLTSYKPIKDPAVMRAIKGKLIEKHQIRFVCFSV